MTALPQISTVDFLCCAFHAEAHNMKFSGWKVRPLSKSQKRARGGGVQGSTWRDANRVYSTAQRQTRSEIIDSLTAQINAMVAGEVERGTSLDMIEGAVSHLRAQVQELGNGESVAPTRMLSQLLGGMSVDDVLSAPTERISLSELRVTYAQDVERLREIGRNRAIRSEFSSKVRDALLSETIDSEQAKIVVFALEWAQG